MPSLCALPNNPFLCDILLSKIISLLIKYTNVNIELQNQILPNKYKDKADFDFPFVRAGDTRVAHELQICIFLSGYKGRPALSNLLNAYLLNSPRLSCNPKSLTPAQSDLAF